MCFLIRTIWEQLQRNTITSLPALWIEPAALKFYCSPRSRKVLLPRGNHKVVVYTVYTMVVSLVAYYIKWDDTIVLYIHKLLEYKGYQISLYILTTAVCGYKGYHISVYLLATARCMAIKDTRFQYTTVSHGGMWL
jgi:hypothetical protein